MRRIAATLAVMAAGGLAIVASGGPKAEAESAFRVDAIFDTSKGIIPGQLVKIAGARVGTVKDVSLTPGYSARVQMNVDRRFAPFRSDARCQIRPEGLISENFVECDPGSPSGAPLPATGGNPPTVPVERTSVPINLSDLFNIWRTPTNQRLTLILASLGTGLAGRGEDLNEVLRRASPTLALTRRAVRTLGEQREHLAGLVRSADIVVSELASKRQRVSSFIEHADKVSARTADKRSELAQAIQRLPGLLDAARPALARLDEVAQNGRPVLADLRASASDLNRLLGRVKPFASAARPALRRLGVAAVQGSKTAKSAGPVVALLRRFARRTRPVGASLNDLLVNLRDMGGIENLLLFAYHGSALTARFDAVSHLGPTRLILPECSGFAEVTVPACNANFGSGTAAARHKGGKRRGARRTLPNLPGAAESAPTTQPRGADDLLAPLRDLLPSLDPDIRLPTGPQGGRETPEQTLRDLLDFLMK